jgi:hypothetical protein
MRTRRAASCTNEASGKSPAERAWLVESRPRWLKRRARRSRVLNRVSKPLGFLSRQSGEISRSASPRSESAR